MNGVEQANEPLIHKSAPEKTSPWYRTWCYVSERPAFTLLNDSRRNGLRLDSCFCPITPTACWLDWFVSEQIVPTKWQGNKFVCKATRLPRYYVRLSAENFISKRLKRYFLFDFNQEPIQRSRGWFVIGGREKYDVYLNSWKAIDYQFFIHNETLFPRKCVKKEGEKSIGVQNLFPLLFSPLKRNAGILILTRHLVHAPLFTLHRVPPRIAR